jgi:hypothetical protein
MSAALGNGAECTEFKEVSADKVIALGLKKTNSFDNFDSRSENRPGSDAPVKFNAERQGGIDL